MLKEAFLSYLRYERNCSEKTVAAYGSDIEEFESFLREMDEDLSPETADGDVVRDWVLALMEQGRAATSVNRKLSALRTFYKFLLRKGVVSVDPTRKVQGPKRKKPLPYFVKEADMNRLLDEVDLGDDFEGVRDRTILEVFYETGVRLSELIGLKNGDVDLEACTVKVTGKRNKQRIIPFGKELQADLKTYLSVKAACCPRESDAFFVRKDGKSMYPSMVYLLVRQALSRVVTMKKRSPHVLRHTFATAMLNHHAELGAVKELLGHTRLTTTEIYTHTTFEELKKEYEQAHPRA